MVKAVEYVKKYKGIINAMPFADILFGKSSRARFLLQNKNL